MKTIFISFFLAASIVSGFSQTQERKLMDRIRKPDMQMENSFQNKAFSKTGEMGSKTAFQANTKYTDLKNAGIKESSFTRSFFGIKNPWFGHKIFETKETDLSSKYVINNIDRKVSVKNADAAGYYDSTKSANFGSPVVPTTAFIPQPAAPGAVAQIKDKITNKMTIDEVRDLLNKPH